MPNAATEANPVGIGERVQSLDVLRGFALFGILAVNILDYAPEPRTPGDTATYWLVNLLAEGSFYPLFSMLFGVGFAIFLDRASARGANGVWLFIRRLAGLFLIGLLQIVFLEDRNILIRYAILALPLLLFWKASSRACLAGGLLCLALSIAQPGLLRNLNQRAMADPVRAAALTAERAAARTEDAARRAEHARVEASRSYREAVVYRARWEVPSDVSWAIDKRNRSLPLIVTMFLFGAAAWRAGLFTRNIPRRRTLGRVSAVAFMVGIAGNLVMSLGPDRDPLPLFASYPVSAIAHTVGDLSLTLGYVAGVLWFLSPLGTLLSRGPALLAQVGRMGLTNYLWQSLMMSVLFLPYGFGLQQRLPAWGCELVGVAIFLSHIPLSVWWLARHPMGPVERLWRLMTYGRLSKTATAIH